jgi:hypothetical protein
MPVPDCQDVVVGPEDADRRPVEWRASDSDPGLGTRTMIWTIVIFAFPCVVVATALRSSPVEPWVVLGAVCVTLVGAAIGVGEWRQDRHAVVDLRLDRAGRPAEFTVRRIDGRVGTYPVDAVTRVRVTRYDSWPPTLSMRITVDGHTVRTRIGLAEEAEALLTAFQAVGATIQTTTVRQDD